MVSLIICLMMCISVFFLHYLVLTSNFFHHIGYKLRLYYFPVVMMAVLFQPTTLGTRPGFWKILCQLDLENLWFHQSVGGHLKEAKLYSILINKEITPKLKQAWVVSWKKIVVGSIYESLTWKIFWLWSQNYWQKMWNIAMKLKVSSISEEIVLCLRTCRQVQEERLLEFRGNHDTYRFFCCLNRGANSFECICFHPYFYHLFACIGTHFQLCICV